ncbi:reverse transcriptase and recombinase [Lasius niger]|uniref:Reverse transcriptase and recombinase n=1 Tax=Lasius niger TaxID=67767 RepID=A0A0J7K733_LASNI|nr:reverse transcriptase and recombinase [Lasius niger]
MAEKRRAEDIQSIYKKLQKIQRKLDTLRADSESSSTNEEEEEVIEEEESDHSDAIKKGQEEEEIEQNNEQTEKENVPPDNLVQNTEKTVSEDILEMLGEDPQKSKALDIVLHDSLKLRWNYWVTHGIEKKSKEELMEKYARSTEFDAPKLNPEISAILSESAAKRDNFMVENQKLAGSALTAIGSALTMVMTEEDDIDKLLFVDRLNGAAKLIMAIHYNETESRKAFIYPGINKQFKTTLKDRKSDVFLFGENLSEKIKESKNIEKLTQNVKNQQVSKNTSQYPKKNLNAKSLQGKRPFTNRAGYSNTQGHNRPRLSFRTKEPYNARARTHRSPSRSTRRTR